MCSPSAGPSQRVRPGVTGEHFSEQTPESLAEVIARFDDARFDPAERLEILATEGVDVLCMAPTEYRVIAKRAELAPLPRLRGLVAAGLDHLALQPRIVARLCVRI